MIEYLEADVSGALIDASNPDNSAVTEEANPNESTTIVAKADNETEIDLK